MRVILAASLALGLSDAARRHQESVGRLEETDSKLMGFASTIEGCQCTSTCNAAIRTGDMCDSCSTGPGCGASGRYDFCDYSPQASFNSKSFSEKISYYAEKLAGDTQARSIPMAPDAFSVTSEELARNPNAMAFDPFTVSMHTSFDNFLPEMPEGRNKFIHSVGAVCGVEFDVQSNSQYTGLLGAGKQKGFVRMGSAVDPNSQGITPGWGFKFPRSGTASGDLVSMWSTSPGQSFNFFASNISNHVPPAKGSASALAQLFQTSTICSTQVGLSDFARYSQDGQKTSNPKFPYKLFFSPTQEVQMSTGRKTQADLLDDFASLPVGTTMFNVYACGKASAFETEGVNTLERTCGDSSYLGTIKVSSKCSASDYGDQKFHIRHQRMEDDWELRPDFKLNGQEACARSDSDWNAGYPERCPGSVMLNSDQ